MLDRSVHRVGRDGEEGGQVMAPAWLAVVAWLYLSVCFCCAGIIACDIAFNRRRQPMGVMNFVFPITALYLGRSRSRCTGAGGEPTPGRWRRCP